MGLLFFAFFFFFFFAFLGPHLHLWGVPGSGFPPSSTLWPDVPPPPHLQHMEVPRLRVQSELQLLACITATATRIRAPSVTYPTAHSNAGSLSPLSEARDQTLVLMDPSQVRYH